MIAVVMMVSGLRVIWRMVRPSKTVVRMNGGTAFDFLDASPAQALAQARQAAAGGDVRIGGGPVE